MNKEDQTQNLKMWLVKKKKKKVNLSILFASACIRS